jgi:hypothetical protein
MNNCGPLDAECDGGGHIACACMCDNCESHDMECQGCDACAEPEYEDGFIAHVWVSALDPRWLICTAHPEEVMIAVA